MSVYRQVQGSNVAVAEKDFRVAANQIIVNAVEKLRRSIASADADHSPHLSVTKHAVKIVQPLVNRSAVSAHPLARKLAHLCAQAEELHGRLNQREPFRVGDVCS